MKRWWGIALGALFGFFMGAGVFDPPRMRGNIAPVYIALQATVGQLFRVSLELELEFYPWEVDELARWFPEGERVSLGHLVSRHGDALDGWGREMVGIRTGRSLLLLSAGEDGEFGVGQDPCMVVEYP